MSLKILKFNPSSVNKKGTFRWFQSKHPQVNETVEIVLNECKVTLSKSAIKEISDKIEDVLKLPRTENMYWEQERSSDY